MHIPEISVIELFKHNKLLSKGLDTSPDLFLNGMNGDTDTWVSSSEPIQQLYSVTSVLNNFSMNSATIKAYICIFLVICLIGSIIFSLIYRWGFNFVCSLTNKPNMVLNPLNETSASLIPEPNTEHIVPISVPRRHSVNR